MIAHKRQNLEEGPILDPVFIEHYWRRGRRPAWLAAWWLAAKMRKLGVPRSARVIDVGCGPGWVVRFLAARFPEMTFVALDLSEPMLKRAHGGPSDTTRSPRVHYIGGDGCRLPFGAESFDVVLSGATLHHLDDVVPLFNEVDRVLRPEGRVIITDLNRDVPRLLWPLVLAADWIEKRLRPAKIRQMGEGIAPSFRAACDAAEIQNLLEESTLARRVRYYPRLFGHWIQTPTRSGNGSSMERRPKPRGRS